MAGEGHFKAAPERRAVNGGDDGFGGTLHCVDGIVQAGRQGRLAEFGDIGAGYEGAAFARKNADFDFRVLPKLLHTLDDGGAHPDADGVDRRIVDPDDADVAALFESTVHVASPNEGAKLTKARGFRASPCGELPRVFRVTANATRLARGEASDPGACRRRPHGFRR